MKMIYKIQDENEPKYAKPFVKWAGGKTSLVDILESQLPLDFDAQQNVTYIEPFVGGGGMLFHMLVHHKNIHRIVINDINVDLMHCYQLIKTNPELLIEELKHIEIDFYHFADQESRELYYYNMRHLYNSGTLTMDERAAYFIFLNRTCFNGLYRENMEGKFNVPFGKTNNPRICDTDTILADQKALRHVDIYVGNYSKMIRHLGKGYNFLFLDPPYRPLTDTSSFMSYSKGGFGDNEQCNLKEFCDTLSQKECKLMLCNSFSFDESGDSFFEKLYNGYWVKKIEAPRYINPYVEKREKQTELLFRNYEYTQDNIADNCREREKTII
jgi:DNA adenine methylase